MFDLKKRIGKIAPLQNFVKGNVDDHGACSMILPTVFADSR